MSISFPVSVTTATLPPLAPARPPELPDFARQRVDRFYADRVQASWGGRHILAGRRPGAGDLLVNNNDYLAIARHPAIVQAQTTALAGVGSGTMMSGIFLQQDDEPVHVLEREIAMTIGTEEAILCQSGYNANVGLVQTLAGERTPVYVDMLAHMSLWEGIRSAGAQAVPIMHNDIEYLERQVLRHGPGVILVDSVYSTNGSLSPLAQIADVAARHRCVFVVDESHSLGTHGLHGEGLVASLGLNDRVHFVTASLSKAYCSRAGLIACSRRYKQYFGFEALPAIFSSSLLAPEVAAIEASHQVIRSEGWRRARLAHVTRRVREGLLELGYPIGDTSEQIVALEAGTEPATMQLRDALEDHGVFGAIFCAPATAKNRALVRLTLNAGMTDADVEHLVGACAAIRDRVGLADWASVRRARRDDRVPQAIVDVA
ncbi:alpha-hydroxyketone-type quorum-sensing autoinducer synthase [Tahibacter soli]|uniref:Quorum-sensing autoinducer CAI-1 synthase n=1 Tax=Tahibacter soli TaxID=2983605 RepID=A0A9X3YHL6_9GAMM|nr:alpha-hydroxyketone-type quorum-sensing autoinducer synthase [Tahibacter soli]MDC8012411.1 quorum-sensing autoinducer CAI-1 synthase [Tahibacter soli]